MTKEHLGILLGGILPAITYGLGGLLQKTCSLGGITPSAYILLISGGVFCGALLSLFWFPFQMPALKITLSAFFIGLSWVLGMIMVSVALSKYGASVSKLAPLYNMNTLIVVILGLIVFSEWKNVSPVQLIVGTLMILGGCVLVTRA